MLCKIKNYFTQRKMMSKIIQKQNDSTKYNRINQIYEMLKK